ncbi:unnamed protein product [Fraxinus pennsylvanica]|uniref:Uncharacterized protein n=1 Tax=Fraxinus pennsylvanica TaxID=56036 RepID=A0AAD1ZM54_9LAMI|nr:unnamed protein product [Fraxinus pennsylvanica]
MEKLVPKVKAYHCLVSEFPTLLYKETQLGERKELVPQIDPRHRYGNNLQLYYKLWSKSSTSQHFFFWLDFGDGKEVDLEECPRSKLDQQCVKYFGPVCDQNYITICKIIFFYIDGMFDKCY